MRRIPAKALVEDFAKVPEVGQADGVAGFGDGVASFVFEQPAGFLQADFPKVIGGRHAGELFELAAQVPAADGEFQG